MDMYGTYRGEVVGTLALLIIGVILALILLLWLVLAFVPSFFILLFEMTAAAVIGTLLTWRLLD